MRTAGEILKNQRLAKKFNLEEVEKATKIRQKFLKFLENDELEKLPGKTYAHGFVKNYSDFLGLPTNKLLAILRRQYHERMKKELIPEGLAKPLSEPKLMTKKFTIPIAFLIAITILGIYFYFQYQLLEAAPKLLIESPKENLIVQGEFVIVKGRTDRETKILINNQEIPVGIEGTFTQKIKMKEEENVIVILAVNKQGKTAKVERLVKKEIP